MSPDKQKTGKLSKNGPPASRRRRWATRFLGILLVLFLLITLLYLIASSNYGMQRFVLPIIAQNAGIELTAEQANLHLPDDATAKGVVMRLLGKDGSLDAILHCKTLDVDLHGPRGITLVADDCDLYITSWELF